MMKGENCLAATFLRAAFLKWALVTPPKAEELRSLMDEFSPRMDEFSPRTVECPDVPEHKVEATCLNWIFGRI
jgi:hypothetical protein